jgi:hypothetical protein
MLNDLSKFLGIWAIVMIMFVCVGMLAFGQLKDFKVMTEILTMLVESALGEWDMEVYNGKGIGGEDLNTIHSLGKYF